jgi:hypothetical protein
LSKRINRTGEKYFSPVYGYIEIIKYYNAYNSTIKFSDGTILNNIIYNHIKNDNVKNPNKPIINNIGYFGIGKYSGRSKHYTTWKNILTRCYDENFQLKQPTYIGCTVDKRWHNFQIFAEWYEKNYIDDWQIDKDILIKGNKIYGPDTCCFVPEEINKLFSKSEASRGKFPIGVYNRNNTYYTQIQKFNKLIYLGTYNSIDKTFEIYKIEKEKYIKEVAEIWKNKIPDIIYQTLINYKIEITD